jgi:hypothetical protein
MTQDQRRDPRFATRQALWCEGQENGLAAETRDISKSGMFIVAENAPAVGEQLKVTIKDEQEGEISLQMEVMWRGPKSEGSKTGVGMRIIGFDKGSDVYERFLARHMKKDDEPRTSSAPRASAAPAAARASEKPSST